MGKFLDERDKKLIINKFVNRDYAKDTSIFKGHYLKEDLSKGGLLKEWYEDIQKNCQMSK